MSDLISRQALCEYALNQKDKSVTPNDIMRFPSTEPEPCEDAVSRQAAIDEIEKIFPADPMRNDYTQGIACGAALAKTYVEQLPSAELATNLQLTCNQLATDCISRQAAIDAVEDWVFNTTDLRQPIEVLRCLPSAQPEREMGEWILINDNNGQHFVCDKCGEWKYHQEQNFCGNCGAKMMGGTG